MVDCQANGPLLQILYLSFAQYFLICILLKYR